MASPSVDTATAAAAAAGAVLVSSMMASDVSAAPNRVRCCTYRDNSASSSDNNDLQSTVEDDVSSGASTVQDSGHLQVDETVRCEHLAESPTDSTLHAASSATNDADVAGLKPESPDTIPEPADGDAAAAETAEGCCAEVVDGYSYNFVSTHLKRMNAVKIKRSHTEGNPKSPDDSHVDGMAASSSSNLFGSSSGSRLSSRSRRHSIQCVLDHRPGNDLADFISGSLFARRLSAVAAADSDDDDETADKTCSGLVSPPAGLRSKSSSSSAVASSTSKKWPRKSTGDLPQQHGRGHRRHGLAARASMFLSGGAAAEARKKSLPDRTNLDAIIRASLELQRQCALASCEVFTLKFELTVNSTDTQTVPALKDFSLGQVLSGPLEQRGLNVDQVDIYLESSNTPLPLSSDCFRLAGSVLHVRPKDDSKRPFVHLKSSSFSAPSSGSNLQQQQQRQNGNLKPRRNGYNGDDCSNSLFPGDVSPYNTLTRGGVTLDAQKFKATKGTSRLQSLFNPFAKAPEKHELLIEILNSYSVNGLPRLSTSDDHQQQQQQQPAVTLYDPQLFWLEDSWTDIVRNHEALDKRHRDHQEAVWELLSTEVEYINKLRVIIDLFMYCLTNLQSTEQLLTEIESDKLFSNVGEVYAATCHFWVNHMGQVVRRSRETGELLNSCLLKTGFLIFDKIFEPYTRYCLEQEMCREYIKTKTAENELFRTFIVWCESQKQCGRLKLADLIVKPWQRLTKYKLLLYAMRSPLDKMELDPGVGDQIASIDSAIEQVEKFMLTVNLALRQRQDHHQLSLTTDRLESYDAVEAPNDECIKLVSEFCKLDLTCPVPGCGPQEIRTLLVEGALRLKDNYAKSDVYCFLFTDMLLVTKNLTRRGDKVKVVKPPMRLDKIIVHPLRDPSSFMLLYLNEYHMAQAVYIFYGDIRMWLDAITKAQAEYRDKRSQYLLRFESVPIDLYSAGDYDGNVSPPLLERPSSAALSYSRALFRQDSCSSEEVSLGGDVALQRSSGDRFGRGSRSDSRLSGRLPADGISISEAFCECDGSMECSSALEICSRGVDATAALAGGTSGVQRSVTDVGGSAEVMRRSCNSDPGIRKHASWCGPEHRVAGGLFGSNETTSSSLLGACVESSNPSGSSSETSLVLYVNGDVASTSDSERGRSGRSVDRDDSLSAAAAAVLEESTPATPVDVTLTTDVVVEVESRLSSTASGITTRNKSCSVNNNNNNNNPPSSTSSSPSPTPSTSLSPQHQRLSLIDQRRIAKELLLNSAALEASEV